MIWNGAQFHLLLNHFPVLGPVFAVPILVAGIFFRSVDAKKIGAWILVASALLTLAAYLTGDPAAQVVKNYPGISRLLVHDHAEAADYALTFAELAGAASLLVLSAPLFFKKSVLNRDWVWPALAALALFSFTVAARTAHLGGLIRHEELRSSDRF